MHSKIEDLAEDAWGREMEKMADVDYLPIESFAESIINICIAESDSVSCRARIREIFGMKAIEDRTTL